MIVKRILICCVLSLLTFSVQAAEPIKVGDISSYTAGASYQTPYKKGWEMALDEINQAGGVLGRPLKFISRDDQGKPEEALRVAEDLVSNEKVDVLTGSGFASVELALSSYSKKNKFLYLPACYNSDRFIWEEFQPYGFRLGGPTPYVFNAMLVERAAKQNKMRWANIGPNYEWGQANWRAFKENLKRYQPDAKIVAEYWPKVNGLDAGQMVQALLKSKPDAIYVTLFGNDLTQFVREGKKRGLFKGRLVVSLSAGMIQVRDQLKSEMPEGWIVLAYPFDEIDTPEMKKFVKNYRALYKEDPDFPSVYGYVWPYFYKQLVEAAKTTDQTELLKKLPGFEFGSVIGPLSIRALDHQSTMGAWIGETTVKDGKAKVVNWDYKDPAPYFPSDKDVRAKQPKE